MGKFWTDEDLDFLKNNHMTMKYKDIAISLDRTEKSIRRKCQKIQLLKKEVIKYNINETFFDNWSSDMAYILGFAMADGYINNKKNYFAVYISKKDENILDYINSFLCPEIKKYYYTKTKIQDDGTIKAYHYTMCRYTSKYMKSRLIDLGIVPQKTGQESLPKELPEEYFWDFLRGYFDGDGSFSYREKENRQGSFFICSKSLSILNEIHKKLNVGRIIDRTEYDDRYDGDFWYWNISDNKSLKYIYDNMYNGEFCLNRKYEKFTHWLNEVSKPTKSRGLIKVL